MRRGLLLLPHGEVAPQSGQKELAVGLHGVKLVGHGALLLKWREGRKGGKAGGRLSPGAARVEEIGLERKERVNEGVLEQQTSEISTR